MMLCTPRADKDRALDLLDALLTFYPDWHREEYGESMKAHLAEWCNRNYINRPQSIVPYLVGTCISGIARAWLAGTTSEV
jgi:hypothetical protein